MNTTHTTVVLDQDLPSNIERLKKLAKISRPGDFIIARMAALQSAGIFKSTDEDTVIFAFKKKRTKLCHGYHGTVSTSALKKPLHAV